jgi:hypothetical protein
MNNKKAPRWRALKKSLYNLLNAGISAPGYMLSAGRAVSPLRYAPLGVSPVQLVPQDKEGFDSFASHEENVNFIFEESVPFRYNPYMFVGKKRKTGVINRIFSGLPRWRGLYFSHITE